MQSIGISGKREVKRAKSSAAIFSNLGSVREPFTHINSNIIRMSKECRLVALSQTTKNKIREDLG